MQLNKIQRMFRKTGTKNIRSDFLHVMQRSCGAYQVTVTSYLAALIGNKTLFNLHQRLKAHAVSYTCINLIYQQTQLHSNSDS